MARVKLGLRNLSIPETIVKGNSVLFQMRNNPNFPPDTVPPLSEIENCLTELKAATFAAVNRDKLMIHKRNKKKNDFLILLRRLGGWISVQTTDKIAIMSSGFEAIEKDWRSKQLIQPDDVRAVYNPQLNLLKIVWKPLPDAREYVVEVSENSYDKHTIWGIAGYTSKAKFIPDMREMKPLTPYYYRVRALGRKGMGPPSNIVKGAIF